ncbi:MAG TPA: hypothetical protein VH440_02275 [Candidatus Limnocylindrales bacterium]
MATRRGWPAAEPAIAAILAQLPDVGGELVVADASGRPAPDLGATVRWLSCPTSMSVFQLRSEAYAAARGELVAQTEDHCRVTPGWARRILELHEQWPNAAAIGGAVEQGDGREPIDWAAFVVTQLPYIAPLANGPVDRTTGATNLSLTRRGVARLPSHPDIGTIELFDSAALRDGGDILVQDDSFVVLHDQSLGVAGTSVIEFHNGRTIGGFRRRAMDRRDWGRVALAGVLPFYRSARAIRAARHKRVPGDALRQAIPWIVWLQLCTSAGELVGYALGPGDSPQRLR